MTSSASQLGLRVDREADVPLGVQLAWALEQRITAGDLSPGDRLPSVRDLAVEAGVNVNTVRAVYARLERDGLTRSEQGRGTFVAARAAEAAPEKGDAALRRELRRRIAMLEAELVRRPQLPAEASAETGGRPAQGRLTTTEELAAIHDDLVGRLRQLDEARADIVRRLDQLRSEGELDEEPRLVFESDSEPPRRSSASLKGARVRWVGA